MRRSRLVMAWTCIVLCITAGPVQGQSPSLDSLLRAHRFIGTFEDGRLSGDALDQIVAASRDAQFVFVGESHNVEQIPLFTAQLFELLQSRFGFAYLALEDGPYIAELLSAPERRGDDAASLALATRYVNALQFWNDQELELIVRAGRASPAPSHPIWGLDQSWGATHILDRLRGLAPTPEARALVARLLDTVRPLESERPQEGRRRYISDSTTSRDIASLATAFGTGSDEAARLIRMLEASNQIYRMRRGGPAVYRSNNMREQYMRQQFITRYEEAVAEGNPQPKVLLKFGQWHAIKGLNWGNVFALGTFVSEFAGAHGMESLHIWTGLVNEPGHFWTLADFPDYVPLAKVGDVNRWTVVDLRAVRPFVASGAIADVNDEMRRVILGFDLALLIGGGNPATNERVR
jgi:hypothetical protein